MSDATADAETLAVYDAGAQDYAARFRFPFDAASIARFVELMPKGGHALDYGCGSGWGAEAMLKAGLTVRALDASPGLVERARAAGVPAEVGVFEDMDDVAAYDGVWASFSLLHAPRDALPGLLTRIHRALKPGGLFYLGVKLGEGESRDRLGRRYAYWTEEDLRTLLAEAGFAWLEHHQEVETGWAGTPDAAIHVFARG
ncbi:MAG: class I SAM-dependent methyltransferase [Pseudomonadota bacterium]